MASYEYRVMMNGERTGCESSSHAAAIDWTRRTLSACAAQTAATVERRRVSAFGGNIWRSHRAYVVDADGIVRRTDRTPRTPQTRCADCGEVGERAGHQTCQYPRDR